MSSETSTDARQSLQPWQFFVLAALGCATTVVFLVRGQGLTSVVVSTVLIFTIVLVGLAALRTLRPLVTPEEDRTAMIGRRTRAALEREKALVLRTIKELEFDRAMGKLAENDWQEMSTRLRARAARLIRQLDAGAGYRDKIEHDLVARLGPSEPAAATEHVCSACRTVNDVDARFCKSCGVKL
ncbi:MAG: zinc ribbon domain-containing protein [Betaproteobacteria bacterium]